MHSPCMLKLLSTNDKDVQLDLDKIASAERIYEAAINEYNNQNYDTALPLLDQLLEYTSHDHSALEMKAQCLLNVGETRQGIETLRQSVHLQNDNREGILHVSKLMYQAGYALQALEEIRECLKLDQDDHECKTHYRKVKKLADAIVKMQDAQESSDYNKCIDRGEQILKLEPSHSGYQLQAKISLCKCHTELGGKEGIDYCKQIVETHPDNYDYQCDLAQAYLNAEMFDDSIRTYQSILGKDRRNERARKGLSQAQKLYKSRNKINYYKILGVSRSATEKEIKVAYRKLAKLYHPDNNQGDKAKEAEENFMKVAAAKEVLTDPKKREMFDRGIDPLDPEQQQQQQHNPFSGFSFTNMHPFQDGHFEFHFG